MVTHAPFLHYLRPFRDIAGTDEQLLAHALQPRYLAENEVLVRQGQVCQELFFIVRGVLRLVGEQEDGTQTAYSFCTENHLCPIIDSLTNRVPAAHGIEAACPTEVLVLPRAVLLDLCAQLPYLQTIIDTATRSRLLTKERLRNQYMGKNAAGRYQLFLRCEPDVARRVALRDVASYLGITQQSLSRIRRQLAG